MSRHSRPLYTSRYENFDYGQGASTIKYRIVRMYANPEVPSRTIKRGLTLAQAQAHCRNPETSSKTARSYAARQRTYNYGPWFDGYDFDTPKRRRR